LAPLTASATQCCLKAGDPYGGPAAANDKCDIKVSVCPNDRTEVDCSSKAFCKELMPICCIYRYVDTTKKNFCSDHEDQSFACGSNNFQPDGTTYDVKYSRCADVPDCTGSLGSTIPSASSPSAATATPSKPTYPIIYPKIPLNIPTVSVPDFMKVTQANGFIYIPFISVFLVGAYKLGIGIAAILAVIMIMAGGFIWIAAAGDAGRIGQAKTMISGAVVGLVLTVGSYVALQTINPNLVSFSALKIPILSTDTIDMGEDPSDISTAAPSGPITAPTWNAQTFSCSAANQPAGVADPGSLVPINCTEGLSASGLQGTPALKEALCKAGVAANKDGYTIVATSTYRTFQKQVELWCGSCATNHPDVNQRKTYCAVPGGSVHGLGNAVDVSLKNSQGTQVITAGSSKAQCKADPAEVTRIANYMEDAGFVRYQNEIWHFEVNSTQSLRGPYKDMPPKCK
jgi:hypothetical protein